MELIKKRRIGRALCTLNEETNEVKYGVKSVRKKYSGSNEGKNYSVQHDYSLRRLAYIETYELTTSQTFAFIQTQVLAPAMSWAKQGSLVGICSCC